MIGKRKIKEIRTQCGQAIVAVGGITRLTESGLSITEWKPVTGAIPPLTEADWMAAFQKYQQIPEYKELNQGMTLGEFQFIYFWEWVHRLLGQLIGLAFALPVLWFAARRAIPRGYGWRLTALLALGGLQGGIGWWMVSSGLSERTDVSHYRLAVHLLTLELLLIWFPFGKLMHAVLFAFSRAATGVRFGHRGVQL